MCVCVCVYARAYVRVCGVRALERVVHADLKVAVEDNDGTYMHAH